MSRRTIGDENRITTREVIAIAGHAGVDQNSQLRSEALRLLAVKHREFQHHDLGCNLGFDLQPWPVVFLVRLGVARWPLRVTSHMTSL
jgi:hypothetical protein